MNEVEDHGTTWRGRPSPTKGTHDWSAQPRVMVDECEGDDPHVFGHLLVALGLALLTFFFVLCALIGAFCLGCAVHDAIASGWSWQSVSESLRDRMGTA